MALLFLSFPATAQPSEIAPSPLMVNVSFVPAQVYPNYDKSVLEPLRAAQAAKAKLVEDARLAKEAATAARVAAAAIPVQPSQAWTSFTNTGELTGSYGYSSPFGNCVLEPGVNNPGWGNPISWAVTSSTPWIGASVLFYFNHVAVVTGFWSNGDIEVRQQNSPGMPHRISRSIIRGYR